MNIILIGFKSSGKSTVGACLAELLNRRFIDTDRLIENNYKLETGQNLDCKSIFSNFGEESFRKYEHAALQSLVVQEEIIIATGGGLPCYPQNQEILKKIGSLVFLDAPLSLISQRTKGSNAPLFLANNMQELYISRHPVYQKIADYVVSVSKDTSPLDLAQKIKQHFAKD